MGILDGRVALHRLGPRVGAEVAKLMAKKGRASSTIRASAAVAKAVSKVR